MGLQVNLMHFEVTLQCMPLSKRIFKTSLQCCLPGGFGYTALMSRQHITNIILIIMTTKNMVRPQLYSDYAPVKHGQETQTILIKDFAHVISVPPSHRNAR